MASTTHSVTELRSSLSQASWIWAKTAAPRQDCYVCFRHCFEVDRIDLKAVLDISSDSDFVCWLNGVEVARGQFSDFAQYKTWSRFSVGSFLRQGINLLAVLVFHRGEDFFDHQAGEPGLIVSLRFGSNSIQTNGASQPSWRAILHPAFRHGKRERVTPQYGFTFEFDAREDIEWTALSFDDRKWPLAAVIQEKEVGAHWKELRPRPLPSLIVGDLQQASIVAQGCFFSCHGKISAGSTAAAMTNAALLSELPSAVFDLADTYDKRYTGPPQNSARFLLPDSKRPLVLRRPSPKSSGRYFILDLGDETVGLLEFEVSANIGSIIEVAYGEHLDDGRVRANVGNRNFADRYICREGRQRFQMAFRRIAARYLEIHVSGYAQIEFYSLGLRTIEYPTVRKGYFKSSDAASNRLQEISLRTLELCRHEHYEDSPWREQSLYAYDARLQALYGYYAFGDYRFPEISFSLLGRSLNDKGTIALTAPSNTRLNIPIFSFTWVVAVAEHWLFSGQPTLFAGHRAAVAAILNSAFQRLDPQKGLYYLPKGREFWHFYEWTPGLSGALGNERTKGVHHAGYNLHLHEAGRAWAWMLEQTGEKRAANELKLRLSDLRTAIHREFWDDETESYRSTIHANGRRSGDHELIQALAVCEGIPPKAIVKKLAHTIIRGDIKPCTLSAAYYLFQASLKFPASFREHITKRFLDCWTRMVLSGATTMWETFAGGADFDYAGSMCHGWSSLPVFYHSALVLGVYPLSKGFESFAIRPLTSCKITAEGKIPTPFGLIRIQRRWSDTEMIIDASGPVKCKPKCIGPSKLKCQISYNGTILMNDHSDRVVK